MSTAPRPEVDATSTGEASKPIGEASGAATPEATEVVALARPSASWPRRRVRTDAPKTSSTLAAAIFAASARRARTCATSPTPLEASADAPPQHQRTAPGPRPHPPTQLHQGSSGPTQPRRAPTQRKRQKRQRHWLQQSPRANAPGQLACQHEPTPRSTQQTCRQPSQHHAASKPRQSATRGADRAGSERCPPARAAARARSAHACASQLCEQRRVAEPPAAVSTASTLRAAHEQRTPHRPAGKRSLPAARSPGPSAPRRVRTPTAPSPQTAPGHEGGCTP